jgi:hypothetical protein
LLLDFSLKLSVTFNFAQTFFGIDGRLSHGSRHF